MSYCIKCGKQNIDTAKFCTGCGTLLETNIIYDNTQSSLPHEKEHEKKVGYPTETKNNTWVIIGVMALFVFGLGVYFIFFNKKKANNLSQEENGFENNNGAYFATVQLDKMNVLYIGIDNPISIVTKNISNDSITANINGGGGSLIKVASGKWIAKVHTLTDDCVIIISIKGKIITTSAFKVRYLPDPVATVGGLMSNENIPVDQFKAQTGIGAYVKDFSYNIQYEVVSYTIAADNVNGDINEAACIGNIWCSAALSIIRNLTSGKTVTIDNITVLGPDSINRKIPGLVYYIK